MSDPTQVTRQQLADAMAALTLDPADVDSLANLSNIRITPDRIDVLRYRLTAAGERIRDARYADGWVVDVSSITVVAA